MKVPSRSKPYRCKQYSLLCLIICLLRNKTSYVIDICFISYFTLIWNNNIGLLKEKNDFFRKSISCSLTPSLGRRTWTKNSSQIYGNNAVMSGAKSVYKSVILSKGFILKPKLISQTSIQLTSSSTKLWRPTLVYLRTHKTFTVVHQEWC